MSSKGLEEIDDIESVDNCSVNAATRWTRPEHYSGYDEKEQDEVVSQEFVEEGQCPTLAFAHTIECRSGALRSIVLYSWRHPVEEDETFALAADEPRAFLAESAPCT